MTRVRFPSPAPIVVFVGLIGGQSFCPCGSVVEHSLGKGEVAGPIPAKGTKFFVIDLFFSESKNGKRKI
jgi:hypothetical protein